ncbi:MAG: ABC transporter substrate-binding protein, partial [Deltaproteobacteria bacterium]|nr:ABC transporter substrate-binding protein [Deltaproteobacteria bacterium]
ALVASLEARMNAVRKHQPLPSQKPKTVMIATGRNMGTGKIEDAYIIGKDGFYQDMIEMVGAQNAYQGGGAFPVVSNEGILRMNPDVIIDMVPDIDKQNISEESILSEWRQMKDLSAVQHKEVHLLTDDYVVVPGPRFILLLEQFSRILSNAPDAKTETVR